MTDKLLEHPQFEDNMIPNGWARVTEGNALPGDKILVRCSDGYMFAPWCENDGADCIQSSGGTTRVDGEMKAYRSVVVREINSNPNHSLKLVRMIELKKAIKSHLNDKETNWDEVLTKVTEAKQFASSIAVN